MAHRKYDTPSQVRISGSDSEIAASVVFHQEQHYLHPNLMYVFGTRETEIEAMRLGVGGDLKWETVTNPRWSYGSKDSYSFTKTGVGYLHSSGAAGGQNIDDQTIQAVAEIHILKTIERHRGEGLGGPLRAVYWFLQRTPYWRVFPRRPRRGHHATRGGDWTALKTLGLRFKVVSLSLDRDDPRLSAERETLEIPGVQIEPINSNLAADIFFAAADALWGCLRILLTVELRQHIATLREDRTSIEEISTTWHSVAVQPRKKITGRPDDNLYSGQRIESFLRKRLVSLTTHPGQHELLYAAAHGYVNSFDPLMWEAGLTSAVEAIERLVSSFEQTRSVSRELVSTKNWKPLAKAIKGAISTLEIPNDIAARVKRQLSSPPTLVLEERILRMAKGFKHKPGTQKLFVGLERLIKARNDIVHGRLIADHNLTYVELLRARAIFERLFLCYCGCASFESNGYALHVIASYDHRRANQQSQGPISVGSADR